MPNSEKMISRLLSAPNDYTYDELKTLLKHFGYIEYTGGKTGGSRRRFFRERDKAVILLHKPHPGNIVKQYVIREVIKNLKGHGDIE